MSQEKVGRNKDVYKDFKNGVKMVDLVAKYRINSSAIDTIIKREKNRERLNAVMPDILNDQN